MTSRLVQPFFQSPYNLHWALYFTVGWHVPQKVHLPVGHPEPYLIHGSLGLPSTILSTVIQLSVILITYLNKKSMPMLSIYTAI